MIINQTGGGSSPEEKTTASASDIAKGKTAYLNGGNGLELVAGNYSATPSTVEDHITYTYAEFYDHTVAPSPGKKIIAACVECDFGGGLAQSTTVVLEGETKEVHQNVEVFVKDGSFGISITNDIDEEIRFHTTAIQI